MDRLEEIRRIKEEVEAELMKRPGVTGVDIGRKYIGGKETDVLAIRIYVEQKRDVADDLALPEQIQGVPTDVIERSFEPHAGISAPAISAAPEEAGGEDPNPFRRKEVNNGSHA